MLSDLAQYIRSCWACQSGGDPPRRNAQAELQLWPATEELGDWCIDLYGPMPPTRAGKRWVFGAVERGRRWPELVALTDATASSVAKALFERVIARHGVPTRITSDQGPQFTGQVMKELCQMMGISKLQTTAYHPQTNSAVERVWPNLTRHLRKLCQSQQQQWDQHLASMEMALRTSEIRTIGVSPYQLMYGSNPRLPMEVISGEVKIRGKIPEVKFVEELQQTLRKQYEVVSKQDRKNREKDICKLKNQRGQLQELEVGDVVMVFTPQAPAGAKRKLVSMWRGPYKIIEKKSSVTYLVEHQLIAPMPNQVVHRNRLKLYHPRQDAEAHQSEMQLAKEQERVRAQQPSYALGMEVQKIVGKKMVKGKRHY